MSKSEKTQRISLLIAGSRFEFNALADKEVHYRNAAKRLNQAIEFYRSEYNAVDMREILYMSYLSLAIELEELKQNKEFNVLIEEVDKLDTKLADYLKEEEDNKE